MFVFPCCSQEVSGRAPLLTCDLRDALQGGHWEGEDDALTGPHPQQALTDQQAGDTNLTWSTDTQSTINMSTITARKM